jgi:hypothetical protein
MRPHQMFMRLLPFAIIVVAGCQGTNAVGPDVVEPQVPPPLVQQPPVPPPEPCDSTARFTCLIGGRPGSTLPGGAPAPTAARPPRAKQPVR